MLSLLENKEERFLKGLLQSRYATISGQIGVSQQAITKHLTLLENAGMVESKASSKGPAREFNLSKNIQYQNRFGPGYLN